MIKLKDLILEVFVPPKSDFDKAAADSEYKIIDIYMDKRGKVYIRDPKIYKDPIPYEDTKAKIQLDYNSNRVRMYKSNIHGNKLDSGVQQLLSGLYKNNIIDSSWKTNFSDDEGYYINRKFALRKGEFEDFPPNFWKRNSKIDLGEKLMLYHGTSDLELPTILKYGLRPLGSKYTAGGTETRVRIEDNKNFLYLSGTFTDAFRYAKSKSISNMIRTDKKRYEWVQYAEWDEWFIKPVVLLVRLPDFTKLRSDDDRVITIIKDEARKIWKSLSDEQRKNEQIKSAQWFKNLGIDYRPEQIEDFLWTISDNGFSVAIQNVNPLEWKDWKASLESHNQVGYEGIIPPNYIEVLDLKKVTYKNT